MRVYTRRCVSKLPARAYCEETESRGLPRISGEWFTGRASEERQPPWRERSSDLLKRVIEAVDGVMPRHAAATRFGIAESTAVKWAPRRSGSQQRRGRILVSGRTLGRSLGSFGLKSEAPAFRFQETLESHTGNSKVYANVRDLGSVWLMPLLRHHSTATRLCGGD